LILIFCGATFIVYAAVTGALVSGGAFAPGGGIVMDFKPKFLACFALSILILSAMAWADQRTGPEDTGGDHT
jgi:hypothetical protein